MIILIKYNLLNLEFIFQYVAIFDLSSDFNCDNFQKLKQEFGKDHFGYYECDVTNKREFLGKYLLVIYFRYLHFIIYFKIFKFITKNLLTK